MSDFGTFLRSQRQTLRLPRAALAARAGLAIETLADLERNFRMPTLVEVRALARALGCPEADLLERSGLIGRVTRTAQ
jgi:transcriptional regulator with XRE-family HTH domain